MAEAEVLQWVREAPFSDPVKLRASPNFSYEQWFARGRKLPGVADTLVELLEKEDLQHPSGDGMRIAYALGWVGDRGPRAIAALIRCLGSKDITLRIEAVAALGRIGDASVVELLENMVKDHRQDKNIRGNACVSLGRLGVRSAEPVLREALTDADRFVVLCAQEGLKLLQAHESPR
jgi:HEAT repeats